MKFMIKPKHQYILLPFAYPIIALVAIINYLQVKKYKQSIIITLLMISMWLISGMIVPIIIAENLKLENFWLSLPGILYSETLNIGIGYLLIRNQKHNIEFI